MLLLIPVRRKTNRSAPDSRCGPPDSFEGEAKRQAEPARDWVRNGYRKGPRRLEGEPATPPGTRERTPPKHWFVETAGRPRGKAGNNDRSNGALRFAPRGSKTAPRPSHTTGRRQPAASCRSESRVSWFGGLGQLRHTYRVITHFDALSVPDPLAGRKEGASGHIVAISG
jgi:hypothetical protein